MDFFSRFSPRFLDIKPFELNFDAIFTTSSSPIELPDYDNDNETGLQDYDSNKRKQPKRAAKVGKAKSSSQGPGQSQSQSQSQPDDGNNTSRKMMIYQGNKFYRDKKLNRRLIWKCCTSRFTNCTAQLSTKPNGKQVILEGSHDHANNTE